MLRTSVHIVSVPQLFGMGTKGSFLKKLWCYVSGEVKN